MLALTDNYTHWLIREFCIGRVIMIDLHSSFATNFLGHNKLATLHPCLGIISKLLLHVIMYRLNEAKT